MAFYEGSPRDFIPWAKVWRQRLQYVIPSFHRPVLVRQLHTLARQVVYDPLAHVGDVVAHALQIPGDQHERQHLMNIARFSMLSVVRSR